MNRSKWKGPFVSKSKQITGKIITAQRNREITLSLVGSVVWVHNGRVLTKIEITEKMVGYKLGSFAPTRSAFVFKKKKKKK